MVKLLEELGIPELTDDQMQALSEIAEKAAGDYIQSRVPLRQISKLDITVEAIGSRPVTISVDVDLALSPLMKRTNAAQLADEAVQKAFEAIDQFLRELSCRSKT